jgi:glutamate synthase (NADPH/NADH) large chain
MSKMGISTYQSYCGAQIFDAIGPVARVRRPLLLRHGNHHRGTRLPELAEETMRRHAAAFGEDPVLSGALDVGGDTPIASAARTTSGRPTQSRSLQHAVRGKGAEAYRQFSSLMNEQAHRNQTVRGLFRLRPAEEGRASACADRRGRAGRRHRAALSPPGR